MPNAYIHPKCNRSQDECLRTAILSGQWIWVSMGTFVAIMLCEYLFVGGKYYFSLIPIVCASLVPWILRLALHLGSINKRIMRSLRFSVFVASISLFWILVPFLVVATFRATPVELKSGVKYFVVQCAAIAWCNLMLLSAAFLFMHIRKFNIYRYPCKIVGFSAIISLFAALCQQLMREVYPDDSHLFISPLVVFTTIGVMTCSLVFSVLSAVLRLRFRKPRGGYFF